MKEFFQELGNSFKYYLTSAKSAPGLYWLWLPAAIFAIWILALLLRFVLIKSKYPFKTIFTIHKRIAIASAVAAAACILLMIYYWSTLYYETYSVQLIHLLSLFLILIVPVVSALLLRAYYKKERLREITAQPNTFLQQEKIIDRSRKGFTQIKLWSLFALTGFAGILFWGFKQEKNLVSIVLDNSYSMHEPLANGKIALTNTFRNLNPNTHIVITSFSAQATKAHSSYNDITGSKRFGITSTNSFHENPESAAELIRTLDTVTNIGSPITQIIWENYQYVKQSFNPKDYKNVVLIIVTDGVDHINASLAGTGTFLCNEKEFNELYPSEHVLIIDVLDQFENGNIFIGLSGQTETIHFFEKGNKCGYEILPGKDLDDYSRAVDQALKEFKRDWSLIFWMIILCALCMLPLIFINPSNNL
ncbi:MAG: vWA domain-containing protein [Chitinophagaceae bacterium]